MNVMPKTSANNQEFTTPIDVIRVYPDKFKKVNNIKIVIEIDFCIDLKFLNRNISCLSSQKAKKEKTPRRRQYTFKAI